MAIIDSFMVYSELDMCDLRFNTLRDAVDWHVVVEAGVTHTNQPKPAYFGDALQSGRWDAFAHKIVYFYADHLEGADNWARERYNRWLISQPLALVAAPDDLVCVCDCDEIPSPEALAQVPPTGAALDMTMYYYSFNWRVHQGWGVGVLPYRAESDPNCIRTLAGHDVPHIANGGWHCGYFLTPEGVVSKMDAFMHSQDVARDVPRDPAWIAAKMRAGQDLFGRTVEIERVASNGNLPAVVRENLPKYQALGWVE